LERFASLLFALPAKIIASNDCGNRPAEDADAKESAKEEDSRHTLPQTRACQKSQIELPSPL
jgi:hypothetical protein